MVESESGSEENNDGSYKDMKLSDILEGKIASVTSEEDKMIDDAPESLGISDTVEDETDYESDSVSEEDVLGASSPLQDSVGDVTNGTSSIKDEGDRTTKKVTPDVSGKALAPVPSGPTRNRKKKKKKKKKRNLKELLVCEPISHIMTKDELNDLSEIIRKNYEKTVLSDIHFERVRTFLETLKLQIDDAICSKVLLTVFGSYSNQLGTKGSDVDICLRFEVDTFSREEILQCREHVLRSVTRVLRKCRDVNRSSVMPILDAKVPIIKFQCWNGIEGDISFYNSLAIENTRLIATYCQWFPMLRPLGIWVKKWSKTVNIGDASQGTLSSYAFTILAIYYLQRLPKPVLPVLQDEPFVTSETKRFFVEGIDVTFCDDLQLKETLECTTDERSLAEYFTGFLDFYCQFDWKNTVVQIRRSRVMSVNEKMEDSIKNDYKWRNWDVHIEDPFLLGRNLGGHLRHERLIRIHGAFLQARLAYRNGMVRDSYEKLSNERRILSQLAFLYDQSAGRTPDIVKEMKEMRTKRLQVQRAIAELTIRTSDKERDELSKRQKGEGRAKQDVRREIIVANSIAVKDSPITRPMVFTNRKYKKVREEQVEVALGGSQQPNVACQQDSQIQNHPDIIIKKSPKKGHTVAAYHLNIPKPPNPPGTKEKRAKDLQLDNRKTLSDIPIYDFGKRPIRRNDERTQLAAESQRTPQKKNIAPSTSQSHALETNFRAHVDFKSSQGYPKTKSPRKPGIGAEHPKTQKPVLNSPRKKDKSANSDLTSQLFHGTVPKTKNIGSSPATQTRKEIQSPLNRQTPLKDKSEIVERKKGRIRTPKKMDGENSVFKLNSDQFPSLVSPTSTTKAPRVNKIANKRGNTK